jgi:hypothetical protein
MCWDCTAYDQDTSGFDRSSGAELLMLNQMTLAGKDSATQHVRTKTAYVHWEQAICSFDYIVAPVVSSAHWAPAGELLLGANSP